MAFGEHRRLVDFPCGDVATRHLGSQAFQVRVLVQAYAAGAIGWIGHIIGHVVDEHGRRRRGPSQDDAKQQLRSRRSIR